MKIFIRFVFLGLGTTHAPKVQQALSLVRGLHPPLREVFLRRASVIVCYGTVLGYGTVVLCYGMVLWYGTMVLCYGMLGYGIMVWYGMVDWGQIWGRA